MEIIEPVTVTSEMGLIQKFENGGMVTYWCKRRNLICKKTTICPMNANQSAVCPAPGSIRIDLYTEDGIKTYIALDEIVSGHIYCFPASDLCYVEYIFGDCGADAVILYNEDGTTEHFGNSKVKMVGYTHDEDLELDIDPLEMFIIVPYNSN